MPVISRPSSSATAADTAAMTSCRFGSGKTAGAGAAAGTAVCLPWPRMALMIIVSAIRQIRPKKTVQIPIRTTNRLDTSGIRMFPPSQIVGPAESPAQGYIVKIITIFTRAKLFLL